jgi:hypothetical protein
MQRSRARSSTIHSLRELILGWAANAHIVDPFVEILSPIMADLEVLEIRSRSSYAPFVSSRLTKLVLWHDSNAPAARFDARLDAIETLELADFDFPRGFLQRYPSLRHVTLSGRFEAGWIENLLTSDLGKLETITLFGTTFYEQDLEALVRHAPRAAHLAKLALSTPWGNISVAARDAAFARLPPNITAR